MDLEALISQTAALSWEDPSSQLETNLPNPATEECSPLVGILISQKIHNNQSVNAALTKAWDFAIPFSFAPLRPNKFLFKFSKKEHLSRIQKFSTWNVNGSLLTLQQWSPKATMDELSSNLSPFWIQIHGLPLENMTIKNAVAIGKGIGEFLKVDDIEGDSITFRSYLRILVDINVQKPLKPGFYFQRDKEEPSWISFRYERLDFYCTLCGKIGHQYTYCRTPTNEQHPESYKIPLNERFYSNQSISKPAWNHNAEASQPPHPLSTLPQPSSTIVSSQVTSDSSPNIPTLTPTILKPLKNLTLTPSHPQVPLTTPHHPHTSLNATQKNLPNTESSEHATSKHFNPSHQASIPSNLPEDLATNQTPTRTKTGHLLVDLNSFNSGPKDSPCKLAHLKMIKKPIPKPTLTSVNWPSPTTIPNISNTISSPANSSLLKQNPSNTISSPANSSLLKQNPPQPPNQEPHPSSTPKTQPKKKRNRIAGTHKPHKKSSAATQLNLQDVEDMDTSYQDDPYPTALNPPLNPTARTYIKASRKAKQALPSPLTQNTTCSGDNELSPSRS
jgi:hypothetical protein